MGHQLQGYVPDYVVKIMDVIAKEGIEPYVVGGAVRDMLRGEEPHDYDLASALRPDELIDVLQRNRIGVVPALGNNFGVVVAVVDGNSLEIATFRSDKYDGSGKHQPDEVVFCTDIKEDLSRRDFTVNALAMGRDGIIVDPYCGQEDLNRKLLRPVGEAERRYREDPLRMYRACRFLGQLGFSYSEDGVHTSDMFCNNKKFWQECNAQNVSRDRVRSEMEKLLLSQNVRNGLHLFMSSGLAEAPCTIKKDGENRLVYPFKDLVHLDKLEQNTEHHVFDAWEHTMYATHYAPKGLVSRYAALFHDVGKGLPGIRAMKENGQPSDHRHEKKSVEIMEKVLIDDLGYQRNIAKKSIWLVKNHMDFTQLLDANQKHIERYVRKKAQGFRNKKEYVCALTLLDAMFRADMKATGMFARENYRNKILPKMEYALQYAEERMVLHSHDLAIPGSDVVDILNRNDAQDIDRKQLYQVLLEKVQLGQVANERQALVESVEKYVKRQKEKQIVVER